MADGVWQMARAASRAHSLSPPILCVFDNLIHRFAFPDEAQPLPGEFLDPRGIVLDPLDLGLKLGIRPLQFTDVPFQLLGMPEHPQIFR